MPESHLTVPTQFIDVDGMHYACRQWGKTGIAPLFHIIHFHGGMEHWDPLLTDDFAKDRGFILFNGRGMASSSGSPRNTAQDMADDIASVIRNVDVLGFSIVAFQAQEVALRHPSPIRKIILIGTGPRARMRILAAPLSEYRRPGSAQFAGGRSHAVAG